MWAVASMVKKIISLYSQDLQSEYKVGVAYIQFTVQTAAKVSFNDSGSEHQINYSFKYRKFSSEIKDLVSLKLNSDGRKC